MYCIVIAYIFMRHVVYVVLFLIELCDRKGLLILNKRYYLY